MNFIGIDLTSGPRSFVYAALDMDGRPAAIGAGSLAEVLAFTCGQSQAYVAVNGPRQTSQGRMRLEAVRQRFSLQLQRGRWPNNRVAEFELRRREIPLVPTPETEGKCKTWQLKSFELYRRLADHGYQAFPANQAPLLTLEVNPLAAYTTLMGQKPFPKASLEGRIQRQLVLYERGLKLRDPMLFFEEVTRFKLLQGVLPLKDIFTPSQLDALVAAYLAWMACNRPEKILLLGDVEDGQIALPTGEKAPQ